MYYILKEGAYYHSLYWIGQDLSRGIEEARRLSKEDADSYHSWNVFEYDSSPDIEDECVYSCTKKSTTDNSQ